MVVVVVSSNGGGGGSSTSSRSGSRSSISNAIRGSGFELLVNVPDASHLPTTIHQIPHPHFTTLFVCLKTAVRSEPAFFLLQRFKPLHNFEREHCVTWQPGFVYKLETNTLAPYSAQTRNP